ncbi:cyclophilin-like domain-containing protein [Suillus placidus]|uniref:Peptidyl-prolyl cis-trans isomerase n=1 Tax=Suillus placidus TaxID=48579 RepID=A0A9P6ZQF5_9AGAM|nr:cyclophilin-like domain-containing protein [Suillus placidus]
MFEEMLNPPKGKGKEKDVRKRKAYVRVMTSLSGSLNLELYCEKVSAAVHQKTCYNCLFHRLQVPSFMVQTGDPTGTGSGGESHWGTPFRDEYDMRGAAKHDSGAGTNMSQFYVTFRATLNLDSKHTVFGKLVGGDDSLDALENSLPVRITETIIHQDPFEVHKAQLARKLVRRDDIDSYGAKVGTGPDLAFGGGAAGVGVGVGKYLSVKRLLDKKRKTVFGNFDS